MSKFIRLIALILIVSMLPIGAMLAQENNGCIVRVYLSRLNLSKYLDLVVNGNYSLMSGDIVVSPQRNMQIKLRLINGVFYSYMNGITSKLSNSIVLKRNSTDLSLENGLRLNNLKNIYSGDLHLNIKDDNIYAILHIPVEEYLLGVVPYEMSDSFPIEALKAQAIAARTYAIKHLNPKDDFDMYDTAQSQVYRGYNKENINSKKAIEETRNICVYIDDNLASCYYSASNGGQTELPLNRWGNVGDSDCYKMVDDPYDTKNKKSPLKTYSLKKDINSDDHDDAQKLICEYLIPFARVNGFNTEIENIRLDKINTVTVDTPKYPEPSRVYTKLNITLNFSGKKELATTEVTATPKPTPVPTPTPFIYSFIKTTPKPIKNLNLGNYIEYDKEVSISIPIFNDVINAFGLALGGGGNYLISVEENKNNFVITSKRYGHGIGMSQRGAEQMANEGLKYTDILNFYYPGIKLHDYTKKDNKIVIEPISTKDPFLQYTPEPLPSPTPLPSPIPLLIDVPKEVEVLVVDNIEKDSFLNLREQAGTGFGVVLKLYYGQELLLVEKVEEGWLHVILNGSDTNTIIEGYVMEEFISYKN